MFLMSGNALFSLRDNVVACLDDDDSVLGFEFGFFHLCSKSVSMGKKRELETYDQIISGPYVAPFLYTTDEDPQIAIWGRQLFVRIPRADNTPFNSKAR